MAVRVIWLLLLLLLIAGCPPQQKGNNSIPSSAKKNALPDKPVNIASELRRLQLLYSEPPDIGNAAGGSAQGNYEIAAVFEGHRAGLKLTARTGGEPWLLWFWDEPDRAALVVSSDEASSGGYRLEADAGEGLTLSISARWVQGRYLQISRELLLSGIDAQQNVPTSSRLWTVEGPWLPYRLVPSPAGPFGVAADADFGAWQSSDYPSVAMVPAIALYDRMGGALVMGADEHARQLSRSYGLRWQIPANYRAGAQAAIEYRVTDAAPGVEDAVFSGKPRRDTVVFEPFKLSAVSEDTTLVEAETRQVIQLLAQAVRAYHLVARPPAQVEGLSVPLGSWLAHGQGAEDFLRISSGIWGGTLSLGPRPADDELITQAREKQYLVFDQGVVPSDISEPLGSADAVKEWFAGVDAHTLDGFELPVMQPDNDGALASVLLTLSTASYLHSNDPRKLFATRQTPSVALPPCLDVQIIDIGQAEAGQNSMLPLSRRCLNYIYSEVFNVAPRISAHGTTLAEQLIFSTAGLAGHEVLPAQQQFDGFEGYANHQLELAENSGELMLLYAEPAASGYCVLGERPAVLSACVASQPARWEGSSAIWICFYGVGGSVTTDYANNITIRWNAADGGAEANSSTGQWVGKLPAGIWKLEHPSPENVEPGDAVLIMRTYAQRTGLPAPDES